MALTLPFIAIQDLTYTAKQLGGDITVTYVNTGTAGSEIVTCTSGSRAISVAIQSGVSTAAQIKTAVEAHSRAASLVTITVTGTAGTAQVSCVRAVLADGTNAVAATKLIGGVLYTAMATGTGGNSVTITYADGAKDCTVISSAITVTFPTATTKASEIVALINATTTAAALVTAFAYNPNSLEVYTSANGGVNLANGAAAIAATAEIQDLTFAADATGAAGNGTTISYTDGATAGAEVVTVVGSALNVQIQSGTSTATQVKTAFDASEAANGAKATGTMTVLDYAAGHLTAAAGSLVVNAYAPLHLTAASKAITFGTPDVLTSATGTVTVTNYATLHKAKAVLAIASITHTAVAYGVAGNSITVEYTNDLAGSGDVAVVEVPTANTILVHMDDTAITGTTGNTIKTAINADPQASALVLSSGTDATVQAVAASAPLAGGQNAATVTVNGIVLTESTEWTAETSNDVTAANIATAITTATATTLCTAVAVTTNVCTIIANAAAAAGNGVTIASSTGTNLAVSAGGVTAGGKAASTITVAGTTFTAVAATPGATEFSTIAELTALIQALATVNASDDASIITVVAATAGTAGNSIAVSKTGAGLTFTGATLTGGYDAATVTVAGHVLTESAEWTASADTATTAESLKDAIHGLTEVNCTRTGSTCAIVAATAGVAGNAIALLVSDATNLTKSGAVLTGGVAASTVTVGTTTLTESTNYTFSADNATSAEALKDAIHALSGVTATRSGAIITIVSDSFGTAGNATALATSNAAVISKSGAFLAGGLAKWDCTVSGTGGTAQKTVNVAAMAGAVGVGPDAYYLDQTTALTSSYASVRWGFRPAQLIIFNDDPSGSNTIIGSWDGVTEHFSIAATKSITVDTPSHIGMWLKYGTGAPAYRVMAI
jgi:hypothetical protein